ncbi:MAG: NAD(P)H-dependent oxidoreductase [Planctomycetota bacterium]
MPRPILLLFAHPALHRSRVNRPLLDAARTVDGVRVFDLYAAYPDFDIDVEEQKRLLLEHEIVVFQHPFFWYSSPAILKEWQDLVLQYGFAYGRGGDKLAGKSLLTAITTGGAAEAYCPAGHNHYTIDEFLRPFEQTADLCGMRYLPPFVVHGTHRLDERDFVEHAADYRAALTRLADPSFDLASIDGDRLNGLGAGLSREVTP